MANEWEVVVNVSLYDPSESVPNDSRVTRSVTLAVASDPEELAPLMHKAIVIPAVSSPIMRRRNDPATRFNPTRIAALVLLAIKYAEST